MKKYLLMFLVTTMILLITGCGGGKKDYNWDENSIANVLPQPETKKVEIISDNEDIFYAVVKKYSETDYKDYVEKCKQNGFDVDIETDDMSFCAYNQDGYKLNLMYYDKELSIELEAPKEFGELKWPSSEIARLLPVPQSSVGEIEWEASYGFVIYVGETPLEDYNSYVDECSQKGFIVDYQKGDDYYYADNNEGYSLTLRYEGNDTMFVRIDEPDSTEISNSEVDDNIDSTTTADTTDSSEDTDLEGDKNTDETKAGVSPDFKKAMDSYEEFIDDYVEFMKKYKDSDDVLSMTADYADYMKQYTETMEAISEIDEENLSTADALYYAEVSGRISAKLLEIAE